MRCLPILVAAALALPATSGAEPLGRLFYTPAQRAQLDTARSRKERPVAPAEAEPPQMLPETVTYDGVVRRSDGKTTVWINNRPIHDGKAPAGVPLTSRVRPDGSVTLGITQSEHSVNLRVGQSIEIVSGTVAEPYARGPVAAKPVPKAADKSAVERPQLQAVPPRSARDPDDEQEARPSAAISDPLRTPSESTRKNR